LAWIKKLATEISAATGKKLTVEQLIDDMREFVVSCPDPVLRASYPRDLHHLMRAASPQSSTIDLILSFMNQRYPGLLVPLTKDFRERLEKAASREKGNVQRVLSKDLYRRYGRDNSYWATTQARLRVKYVGIYVLVRLDSSSELRAEPFAMALNSKNPALLSTCWRVGETMLVGDLLVNTYRFTGTMVSRSSDDVINPILVSLLRTPRRAGPLIMGGLSIGHTDGSLNSLFYSRLLLIRLIADHEIIRSRADDLSTAITSRRLAKMLEQFRSKLSAAHRLERFLSNRQDTLNALDARNAVLPELQSALMPLLEQ
jgi:hypothetical protein